MWKLALEMGRDLTQSIWQKPHIPSENQSKNRTKVEKKNFDYTTNVDRLRTVSLSTFCNHDLVKPVYGIQAFPLNPTAVQYNGHGMLLFTIQTYLNKDGYILKYDEIT